MKEYHLLNGDSLKSQLQVLEGERIVIRECFIEGNAKGNNLEEIFHNRSLFFEESYEIDQEEYREKSILEITKITEIGENSIINLWFENDLFCQANFWFSVSTLYQLGGTHQLFLVSPIIDSWKGFGALNEEELVQSYQKRKALSKEDQQLIHNLWVAFQESNWQELKMNATKLNQTIDHIEDVVQAHIDRFPATNKYGRPQKSILAIMQQLDEPNFPNVFKEFCKKEGIYGFGDLQVKRMMEEMDTSLLLK